jgi:hypothetical protein
MSFLDRILKTESARKEQRGTTGPARRGLRLLPKLQFNCLDCVAQIAQVSKNFL